MLANTSRMLLAGLSFALLTAAGCQGHTASATASPVNASTHRTRASIPIAAPAEGNAVVIGRMPRGAERKLPKGIGAMGGPAGREDLRPNVAQ